MNRPANGRRVVSRGAVMTVWRPLLLLTATFLAPAPAGIAADTPPLPPPLARTVDYVADVQPILAKSCYSCHGPDKQRGGLRLDLKARALKGGDNGAAIVPGKGADSLLVRYVAGLDPMIENAAQGRSAFGGAGGDPADLDRPGGEVAGPGRRRPRGGLVVAAAAGPAGRAPTDGGRRAMGPQRRSTPSSSPGCARRGCTPSPEADRRTLMRRLYLRPDRPAADARGDRRLRQGRRRRTPTRSWSTACWPRRATASAGAGTGSTWSTTATRTATTRTSAATNAWPYRDYVIRAFNDDKPYGRFVREQVAGDVLFPDDPTASTATRLHRGRAVGLRRPRRAARGNGRQGKIARLLDRDDMVANTIDTFVSLTVHCARCHDHKFDPIPQEDYYRLQAVFAGVDRADRPYDADPIAAKRRGRAAKRGRSAAERAARPKLTRELPGRPGRSSPTSTRRSPRRKRHAAGRPAPAAAFGYHSGIMPTAGRRQMGAGRPGPVGGRSSAVVLRPCHDDFTDIGAASASRCASRSRCRTTRVQTGRRGDRRPDTKDDVRQPRRSSRMTFAAGGRTARYVRVTATKLAAAPERLHLRPGGAGGVSTSAARTSRPGRSSRRSIPSRPPPRWRKANLVDGYVPGAGPADAGTGPAARRARAAWSPTPLSDEDRSGARRAPSATWPRSTPSLAALPPQRVAYVGADPQRQPAAFRGTGPDGGKPRPIHVLPRGDVDQPGKEVGPGALSVLRRPAEPLPPAARPRRGRAPRRPGPLAHRPEERADLALDRQPRLALPLRPRHRRHAQRLRPHGPAADAPRAARLAGGRVPRRRRSRSRRCTG